LNICHNCVLEGCHIEPQGAFRRQEREDIYLPTPAVVHHNGMANVVLNNGQMRSAHLLGDYHGRIPPAPSAQSIAEKGARKLAEIRKASAAKTKKKAENALGIRGRGRGTRGTRARAQGRAGSQRGGAASQRGSAASQRGGAPARGGRARGRARRGIPDRAPMLVDENGEEDMLADGYQFAHSSSGSSSSQGARTHGSGTSSSRETSEAESSDDDEEMYEDDDDDEDI
jgi:hypothetical protein